MAKQVSLNFFASANGTTVIEGSGVGLIINAIYINISGGAGGAGTTINFTDNVGTSLMQFGIFSGGANINTNTSVSSLNLPTTSVGGLSIIVTLAASANLDLTIFYTKP